MRDLISRRFYQPQHVLDTRIIIELLCEGSTPVVAEYFREIVEVNCGFDVTVLI